MGVFPRLSFSPCLPFVHILIPPYHPHYIMLNPLSPPPIRYSFTYPLSPIPPPQYHTSLSIPITLCRIPNSLELFSSPPLFAVSPLFCVFPDQVDPHELVCSVRAAAAVLSHPVLFSLSAMVGLGRKWRLSSGDAPGVDASSLVHPSRVF